MLVRWLLFIVLLSGIASAQTQTPIPARKQSTLQDYQAAVADLQVALNIERKYTQDLLERIKQLEAENAKLKGQK